MQLKQSETECLQSSRNQPSNGLLTVQHTKLRQIIFKTENHTSALKTYQKIKVLHSQKKLINNYCTLVHIVVGHRPTGLYDVFVVAIKFSESI